MSREDRKVTRVLVMLEYEPGDPDNGEVYDLTPLALDLMKQCSFNPHINLQVCAKNNYSTVPCPDCKLEKKQECVTCKGRGYVSAPPDTVVRWSAYAGEFSANSGHLADVINSALPDGDRVKSYKTRAKNLRKKADELDRQAAEAKIEQVAAVRHQYPVARVTSSPIAALNNGKEEA